MARLLCLWNFVTPLFINQQFRIGTVCMHKWNAIGFVSADNHRQDNTIANTPSAGDLPPAEGLNQNKRRNSLNICAALNKDKSGNQ